MFSMAQQLHLMLGCWVLPWIGPEIKNQVSKKLGQEFRLLEGLKALRANAELELNIFSFFPGFGFSCVCFPYKKEFQILIESNVPKISPHECSTFLTFPWNLSLKFLKKRKKETNFLPHHFLNFDIFSFFFSLSFSLQIFFFFQTKVR